MDPPKILIVANHTSGGAHLRGFVRERMMHGPVAFTVLVPATRPHGGAVWTEGEAHAIAQQRLTEALRALRALGADVGGRIGSARPIEAIDDVLREEPFDEIVISTLPPGASRWLHQDLPARARRHFDIPVTHLPARADDLEQGLRAG